MNKITPIALALALGLMACSQDENLPPAAGDAIRITATVNNFAGPQGDTRAIIDEDGTGRFEAGDEVSLHAFINDATNIVNPYPDAPGNMYTLTYESGAWNGFAPTWNDLGEPTNDNRRCFAAFYPKPQASSISGKQLAFSVAANQSDEAAYKASDLLFAYQNYQTKPQDGSVALNFNHFMTRIKVKFLGNGELVNKATVVIKNISAQCQISITDGSIMATPTPRTDIIPRASAHAGIFYALVPSQAVADGLLELAISVDGKVTSHKVAIPDGFLYSGQQCAIELTLKDGDANTGN